MVFDAEANNQDLCTLADLLVKTDNTDFPLAEKALYANMRLREVLLWIWSVYGGWISDDTNNSGEPVVTASLVTTPRNIYAFAGTQMIDSMEWQDNSGSWNPLKPITIEEMQMMGYSETEFMKTAGNPIYYRPVQGTGVRLYPDPDTARSNALKAHIRRDAVNFTAASTSTSPGFDSIFHEKLAVGMALTYAMINSLDKAVELQRQWDGNEEVTKVEGGFKKAIKKHYGEKYRQNFPQNIKTNRADFVGQYI